MLQKLKTKLILIIGAAMLLMPVLMPAVASAEASDISGNLCTGVGAATGDTTSNCDSANANTSIDSIVSTIINIFSIIVGAVSVIMIIVGGFRYIISGGNDSGVAGAKNTIVYALIGLVIVALAQVIVHFVLAKALNAGAAS